jgi:putative serine protease PepD
MPPPGEATPPEQAPGPSPAAGSGSASASGGWGSTPLPPPPGSSPPEDRPSPPPPPPPPAAQWPPPSPPPAGTPPAGGPVPGWSAPALPAGWGAAPPPGWPPPVDPPSGASRRAVLIVGTGMLAIGLAVGAAVTAAFARESSSRTANVLVNDQPTTAGASGGAGNAVQVANALGPAVGTIIAKQGTGQNGGAALGSGVVIAHDGSSSYLITNNHVVDGAREVDLIMPGGKNLRATVVGTDSFDDLAVISVADTSLKQAVFGKSSQLQVGQQVVAIGSPLGNEGSVTAGVISALHRTISAGSGTSTSSETLQDVLQTDASINPGNSGGPLADMQGRVIGINVAVAGNTSRIGFSIPSDLAQSVAQALIARQPVRHPFLGISYLTAIDATENGQAFTGPGVLVTKVVDGTPAAQAGFHSNDVLVAVNGTDLDNGMTLGGLIQQYHVGDQVTFTVRRGGQTLKLQATLTDRPKGQ